MASRKKNRRGTAADERAQRIQKEKEAERNLELILAESAWAIVTHDHPVTPRPDKFRWTYTVGASRIGMPEIALFSQQDEAAKHSVNLLADVQRTHGRPYEEGEIVKILSSVFRVSYMRELTDFPYAVQRYPFVRVVWARRIS